MERLIPEQMQCRTTWRLFTSEVVRLGMMDLNPCRLTGRLDRCRGLPRVGRNARVRRIVLGDVAGRVGDGQVAAREGTFNTSFNYQGRWETYIDKS